MPNLGSGPPRPDSGASPSAAQDVRFTITPERESILQGEPLLLDVTVTNNSPEPVNVPGDSGSFPRIITGPGGLRSVTVPQPREGDTATFYAKTNPGGSPKVRIVARETCRLRNQGEYRITVGIDGFNAKASASFRVLPRDETAFRKRALEIQTEAEDGTALDQFAAAEGLVAMDAPVVEPLVCQILLHGAVTDHVMARALESMGGGPAVNCLLQALPDARGATRSVVASALTALSAQTSDEELRARIRKSLSPASPR